MRWSIPCILLLTMILNQDCFSGTWHSQELWAISWGEGENELLFFEETRNVPTPPADPDEYDIDPAEGPDRAFVDMNENITVLTSTLGQLKCFSDSGGLIFDFSIESSDYDPEMYYEVPEEIYVDSLSRLYVQSHPGTQYVPVINYSGEIVEWIRPFPQDSNAYIHYMRWTPTGTLFFFNRTYEWVTYSNGQSTPGGSTGFLASNGSFYTARKKTANSLEFKRFENPDSTGLAESRQLTEVPVAVDTLVGAGLLNGGDGQSLYVIMSVNEYHNYEIWQFDLSYNFMDKLVLPVEEAYQGLRILPFVRRDGNIYEFRFREDGFHVVRWSRE